VASGLCAKRWRKLACGWGPRCSRSTITQLTVWKRLIPVLKSVVWTETKIQTRLLLKQTLAIQSLRCLRTSIAARCFPVSPRSLSSLPPRAHTVACLAPPIRIREQSRRGALEFLALNSQVETTSTSFVSATVWCEESHDWGTMSFYDGLDSEISLSVCFSSSVTLPSLWCAINVLIRLNYDVYLNFFACFLCFISRGVFSVVVGSIYVDGIASSAALDAACELLRVN
jgi:hypothetical protein